VEEAGAGGAEGAAAGGAVAAAGALLHPSAALAPVVVAGDPRAVRVEASLHSPDKWHPGPVRSSDLAAAQAISSGLAAGGQVAVKSHRARRRATGRGACCRSDRGVDRAGDREHLPDLLVLDPEAHSAPIWGPELVIDRGRGSPEAASDRRIAQTLVDS
jgi:hypothetical protein